MYMLLGYSEAVVVEAVVLTTALNRMRVAASGFGDALELTRENNRWYAEGGIPVEFEFVAALESPNDAFAPAMTRAAG